MVDWSKPIQFKNGERCELIRTNPNGWRQWGPRTDGAYPTREVRRLEVDDSSEGGKIASRWYVYEDGNSDWPDRFGYSIINPTD